MPRFLRPATIVMLLLAFAPMPIGYYRLLRIVVCVLAAYCAYAATGARWRWTWAVTAVVFNPILPLYFGRDIWRLLDALAIAVVIGSLAREDDGAQTRQREGLP